jgi:CRP-like cAMP-binding protein
MSDIPSETLAGRLIAALPSSRRSTVRVTRGAAIFRQGDPALAVYVVVQGRVRLGRMSPDGVPLTLHVADAGDSFAEASLSATEYHCDAIAEKDSVVLVLPKADLLALLARDPAQGAALALTLASQVRDLRARLELRNIRPAKQRVLTWLRLEAVGDAPYVRLRRSWTLIAQELGLTREAVYRALALLEQQGHIARENGVVSLVRRSGQDPTSAAS